MTEVSSLMPEVTVLKPSRASLQGVFLSHLELLDLVGVGGTHGRIGGSRYQVVL
jgi:hypothetical protein